MESESETRGRRSWTGTSSRASGKNSKGHAREEWGKLTDDELEEVGGKKDRLVGKLQQKYGYAADEADRRADEWAKQQDEATKT